MWWYVAVWVVSFVAAYYLTPKPSQTVSPSSEINVNTAEVGKEIGVLFGTRTIKSSNIVWYGDLKVSSVKKKGGKK